MRDKILKLVLFSIITCYFEYAKKELYFINERKIYLERNIINFKNNRILADSNNQFDLNNFYESTLSLANQFNDYNDGDGEITNVRNAIDSQIKKYKESNTLPNLNNVDNKTKRVIHELRKEFEEVKKEIDNKRNGELGIQLIQDKRIIKKDENILEAKYDNFKYEYDEIISNNNYKELKTNKKLKKEEKQLLVGGLTLIGSVFAIVASGQMYLLLLLAPCLLLIFKSWRKFNKYRFNM
ncbi:fam-b protein [Plasmodium vinckei vinckei]|uniref:Fam-b protein n=1 Tax=Plasmodium vinckei vinckei TaxID=54757 RepID=A0A449BUU6_PLAVN|nr:fam-b protein [Plasmodium vinckei vinckei]VEV57109.1 fam-b protein [Plasmodium vinckei vinckei]